MILKEQWLLYLCCLCIVLSCKTSVDQIPLDENEAPQVVNIRTFQSDLPKQFKIQFDLIDKENDSIQIKIQSSLDSGRTYTTFNNATGDVGFPIHTGPNKQIIFRTDESTAPELLRLIVTDRKRINYASLAKQVDMKLVEQNLKRIVGERNHSSQEAKRHLIDTREFIMNCFDNHQLQTRTQSVQVLNPHKDNKTLNTELIQIENIIGKVYGQQNEEKVHLLTAHYDSYLGSPGLDDNATGVAGLIEAMRVLSYYHFQESLVFVAFDLEEYGLVGSNSYVFSGGIQENEVVQNVINLDMIGVFSDEPNTQSIPEGFEIIFPDAVKYVRENSFKGNFVVNISNKESSLLNETFIDMGKKYIEDFRIIPLVAKEDWEAIPDLVGSDHASFWHGGYNAIHVGEGGPTRNSLIHTSQDGFDHVDINYEEMRKVIQATVISLASLAKIQRGTLVYIEL